MLFALPCPIDVSAPRLCELGHEGKPRDIHTVHDNIVNPRTLNYFLALSVSLKACALENAYERAVGIGAASVLVVAGCPAKLNHKMACDKNEDRLKALAPDEKARGALRVVKEAQQK